MKVLLRILAVLSLFWTAIAQAYTLAEQTVTIHPDDSAIVNQHGEVVFMREMADGDQLVRVRVHFRDAATLQQLRSLHDTVSVPLSKLSLVNNESPTGDLKVQTKSLTDVLRAQTKPLCGNQWAKGLYFVDGEPVWVTFEKYFSDPTSDDPVLTSRPTSPTEVAATCSTFGHCGGTCTTCVDCTTTFGRCVSSNDCTEKQGKCTRRGFGGTFACDCL